VSRHLLIDIGAGTMDVLVWDDDLEHHFKAVVRSPVRTLADRVAALPGNLAVTGVEMGGGPVAARLRERAKTADVAISPSAAATVHHDPERVRAAGLRILPEEEVRELGERSDYRTLELADLDPERLRNLVNGFDVPFQFDAVGVCAQDHGVAPPGASHLDYRHNLFREALTADPHPEACLYPSEAIPETFNRLRAIAATAARLPTREVFVMDSGMAAVLGASLDPLRDGRKRVLVLDVATSHTVGGAMDGDALAGFFEYHTHDMTRERLESLLIGLAEGALSHEGVLAEGGHGAWIRSAIGRSAAEPVIATGPLRGRMVGSKLGVAWGAPLGDNMMTGTLGLLEAIRRRKGLATPDYR